MGAYDRELFYDSLNSMDYEIFLNNFQHYIDMDDRRYVFENGVSVLYL